ncbi:MAG TPA: DUF2652 domain-containing protein [Rhodospirillaceae bacterium]|nr:DUF2652 domain-containing protein [Rhodospirillaceae bacterium]
MAPGSRDLHNRGIAGTLTAMAQSDQSDSHILLADISGYTGFLRANQVTLRHANYIISELLAAIIKQARSPVRPDKLEGDAVLLVAPVDGSTKADSMVRQSIGDFFQAFDRRRAQLIADNGCGCEACMTIGQLDLKVVSHFGPVLRYKLAQFDELAGFDMIIAHRLLKNSLDCSRYLMISEAAWARLSPVADLSFERHVESYEGVGEIPVMVMRGGWSADANAPSDQETTLFRRLSDFVVKHVMLLPFGKALIRRNAKRALHHHDHHRH